MAKPKTIYPLKGVFTRFLEDTNKNCFMIPAYQRGFKWTSTGGDSHVEVLLRDLYSAFEKGNANRYYLQFLTLKEKNDQLEVIDGQQRLTTLTILFCILSQFQEVEIEDEFFQYKLKYQVRENFVKEYIYENIDKVLDTKDWPDFIKDNPEHDNQDVFFIYHAAKCIDSFIESYIDESKRNSFYNYLSNDVFLIVNLVQNINSEKIFVNVNKGVKLEDEDLVKGLLLTKIPLDNQNQHYRSTENEINEIRTNIGRQWDDLTRWASRNDITSFFKRNSRYNNRLDWLIQLAYPNVRNVENLNPMFSYLDDLYRTGKKPVVEIFKEIRKTMLKLNDWCEETELCNLLGYLIHVNNSKGIGILWQTLNTQNTKKSLLQKLKAMCKDLIPIDGEENGLQKLNYEDFKHELFNLFLLLDVAKFLPIGGRTSSHYDFSKITLGKWSIEHIFPQTAKDFQNTTMLGEADLLIIKELLPGNIDEISVDDQENMEEILALYKKLKKSNKECSIDEDERNYLHFLLEKKAKDLHRLGNLALLQQGMNSELSNHFFDGKRKKIAQKVSEGIFVPFHTYDIFSKLIITTNVGLHVWSKADIEKHEEYIQKQISSIITYLNTESLES